jgi:hypothetical protein
MITAQAKTNIILGKEYLNKECSFHKGSFFSGTPGDYDHCSVCITEENNKIEQEKINKENKERLLKNTIPNTLSKGAKSWCGRCQQYTHTVEGWANEHYCCSVCGTDNNIKFEINKYGNYVQV